MSKIFDSFSSTFPKNKIGRLYDILEIKKNSGEIVSQQEYEALLRELNERVVDNNKPILQLPLQNSYSKTSSFLINEQLIQSRKDLEVLFEQCNSNQNLLNSHFNLFFENVISSLEKNILYLERLFEEVKSQNSSDRLKNVYFDGLYKGITTQKITDPIYRNLYIDHQTGLPIKSDQIIYASDSGGITLPPKNKKTIYFAEAKVYDGIKIDNLPLTDTSDITDNIDVNTLYNSLDGDSKTFWQHKVAKLKVYGSPFKSRVKFDFNGYKRVNQLNINPISSSPFYITQIWVKEVGDVAFYGVLNSEILTSSKPISINFSEKNIKEMYIDISQPNYKRENIKLKSGDSLSKSISDNSIYSEILKNQAEEKAIEAYVYSFGFEDVSAAFVEYYRSGVYVSGPVSSVSPISIQLDHSYNGSNSLLEFWITENVIRNNLVIEQLKYPILKKGETSFAEVSVLQNNKFLYSTFRAHPPQTISESSQWNQISLYNEQTLTNLAYLRSLCDIKLYKNGSLLTYGEDWVIENTSAQDESQPYTKIRLTDKTESSSDNTFQASNPDKIQDDIYILDYKPIFTIKHNNFYLSDVIDFKPGYLDSLTGYKYNKDGTIIIPYETNYRSDFYISIQMRNATSISSISDKLQSFKLSIGTGEESKQAKI